MREQFDQRDIDDAEAEDAKEAAHEAGWLPWLEKLETIMRAWDKAHGNLPYTLPLTNADNEGNALCWRDSHDDGMTPEEAFAEDQKYWVDQ